MVFYVFDVYFHQYIEVIYPPCTCILEDKFFAYIVPLYVK